MERSVTATELARNVGEILARVRYQGDSYVIERNGEIIARILPEPPKKEMTVADLVELFRSFGPDLEFADLLEEINDAEYPPDEPFEFADDE